MSVQPTGNCHYCRQPITWNEFDGESNSFMSAHFPCVSPAVDGRYQVAGRRYTTLARAESEAQYLADCNHRHSFLVFDHAEGRFVAHASMGEAQRQRWIGWYSPELAAQ